MPTNTKILFRPAFCVRDENKVSEKSRKFDFQGQKVKKSESRQLPDISHPCLNTKMIFFGFVKINDEKIVPYTTKEKVKYVPLSYFLSDSYSHSFDVNDLIKNKVDCWELEYLRFCATILCSDNELVNCNITSLIECIVLLWSRLFCSRMEFHDQ